MCETHRHCLCLGILLILSAQLPQLCTAQAVNATAVCDAAVAATWFQARVSAAARNATLPATAAQSVADIPDVSPQLVAAYVTANSQLTARAVAFQTNLLNMFPGPPYAGWGDRAIQVVFGQTVHIPAATAGEVAFVVNSLRTTANASTPVEAALQQWFDIWIRLSIRLKGAAANNTDVFSQRALLLRSLVYAHAAAWALPPGPRTLQVYNEAHETFMDALDTFEGVYRFIPFNYTYSNGTVTQTFEALFGSPAEEKRPLMVLFASLNQWKELTFLRFGLGALRRNYAIVIMDLPGQVPSLVQPPYMRAVTDYTNLTRVVLDAVARDPDMSRLADLNKMVFLGAHLANMGASRACIGTGKAVGACVLNPPVYDARANTVSSLARFLFGPTAVVANMSNALFPTPELAALFKDPARNIAFPLLHNCTPDSEANEAVAAAFNAIGYDPDVGFAITSNMGVVPPYDIASVYSQALPGFLRAATGFGVVNASAMASPTLLLSGDQDATFAGQELSFFAQLPPQVQSRSKFVRFTGDTGAALTAQTGAGIVFEEEAYPWLDATLG